MVPSDPAPPRTGWISFAPAACPGAAYRDIRDKYGYTTDRIPNHHGTCAGEPSASGRPAPVPAGTADRSTRRRPRESYRRVSPFCTPMSRAEAYPVRRLFTALAAIAAMAVSLPVPAAAASTWTIQATALPAGAERGSLQGVSCITRKRLHRGWLLRQAQRHPDPGRGVGRHGVDGAGNAQPRRAQQ